MNRYHKALCSDHQRSNGTSGTTRDLQDLMRERHNDELIQETPVLKTVKDWIEADFETWEKVLKKEGEERYSVTVSGEEGKNRDQKRVNNKDKSMNQKGGRISLIESIIDKGIKRVEGVEEGETVECE